MDSLKPTNFCNDTSNSVSRKRKSHTHPRTTREQGENKERNNKRTRREQENKERRNNKRTRREQGENKERTRREQGANKERTRREQGENKERTRREQEEPQPMSSSSARAADVAKQKDDKGGEQGEKQESKDMDTSRDSPKPRAQAPPPKLVFSPSAAAKTSTDSAPRTSETKPGAADKVATATAAAAPRKQMLPDFAPKVHEGEDEDDEDDDDDDEEEEEEEDDDDDDDDDEDEDDEDEDGDDDGDDDDENEGTGEKGAKGSDGPHKAEATQDVAAESPRKRSSQSSPDKAKPGDKGSGTSTAASSPSKHG